MKDYTSTLLREELGRQYYCTNSTTNSTWEYHMPLGGRHVVVVHVDVDAVDVDVERVA
jgi:hypothetical protein